MSSPPLHGPASHLDVRGFCCPLPLIQLAKTVKTLAPGQTLEVKGNDPIFESSVRDYCHANGHVVLEALPDDAHGVRIVIRIGG
jgi:tRNA 2-thiouridine synthesizing protein A